MPQRSEEEQEASKCCSHCCNGCIALGLAIFGLVAISTDENVECTKDLLWLAEIHVIFTFINMAYFFWSMIRTGLDFETRRRFKYLGLPLRLATFIWAFIFFGYAIDLYFVKGLGDCEEGGTVRTFILICFILQAIAFGMAAIFLVCCCPCLCAAAVNSANEQNENQVQARHRDDEWDQQIAALEAARNEMHRRGQQSDLSSATRTVSGGRNPNIAKVLKYSQAALGIDHEIDDNCSICMTEFGNSDPTRALPCDHIFHDVCIEQWFTRQRDQMRPLSCPNCRQQINRATSQYQAHPISV